MACNIYENFKAETSERTIKATIGITKSQFATLSVAFESAHHAIQKERLERREIKALPKGGVKGCLSSFEIQLFFILFYLKTYLTFDVLGLLFGLSAGHAHEYVKSLLPVLQRALADLGALPKRHIENVDELRQLLSGLDGVALDGVEVTCVRPQDPAQQKERYSGKKNGMDLKRSP